MPPVLGISSEFLSELREDIAFRRIHAGMQRLDRSRGLVTRFDAAAPNAIPFLGYLAQWVDAGYRDASVVRDLLACFPKPRAARVSLSGYVHLRMAEGFVKMADEEPNEAIRHFEMILLLEDEIEERELLAIAHFWVGRCLRKRGEYDKARDHTVRGRDLALQLGYQPMAAVMRVLESWLMFQEGRPKEALRILDEAEQALAETGDHVTLGNIHSARGRVALRHGHCEESVECFLRAIEEYRKHSPQHRNLARTLANLAYAERLIALRLGRRIDAEAERRRAAGARGRLSIPHTRERLTQIRAGALAHLDQAAAIFAVHPQHRGEGTVQVNRGLLYLDAGEWDLAAAEGARAYEHGELKRDAILLARARLLQCIVENAKLDEEIEERADPARHARLARQFAGEAVEFAGKTQNRRLLARTWIWNGMTLANEFFHNPGAAAEWYQKAVAALKSEPHGQLWEELQALKVRLLHAQPEDSALRAWSQGEVGGQSFQEIAEAFAGIVIPKVWEREGRKISLTAKRLSISPKKVRRILKGAGLKVPNEEPEKEPDE